MSRNTSRNTKSYRKWRARSLRKGKRCALCGDLTNRVVHHLFDFTNYPKLRYKTSNSVVLCKAHHSLFHTSFKNSYKESCTQKDFENFKELYYKLEEEFL